MTAEHKYEMTISLQIVEHLGLNLYSNTSAVISEAVANAWDADAKTVEITLEKDCITIKDDGCGMDTDDINNKYLTVGYQKRHLVPITPMLNRKVMGRKGIGKLAQIRADWEAERSEAGEEEACKYEVVREWYSGLIGDEKKAAKQLFGKINQLTVTPDEKKDIFKHGILAFESLKLKNELSALQDVQPDNLDIFLNVAGRLDSIEATYYYQIVKSRLAVIQRMKEVVHGDDLEKVIQRHCTSRQVFLCTHQDSQKT